MGEVLDKPWVKSYPREVPLHLEYPKVNAFYLLERGVELAGERDALVFFGKRINYRELYRSTLSLAASLQRLGVGKGTRVAFLLPNCPVYPMAYYALLKIGAIVVQLNPMYTPRELNLLLEDSGARMVITLDILAFKFEEALEQRLIDKLIVANMKDFLPFPLNLLFPLKVRKQPKLDMGRYGDRVENFLPSIKETGEPEPVEIDPEEDVAVFQYTGGTTGISKAAMLTHSNLVANTVQTRTWTYRSQDAREVVMCVLPFFHVYGMTAAMNVGFYMGSTLVLVPRFEVKEVVHLIKKYKVTMFPGVPTIYVAINQYASDHKVDLSSVEVCISGGAPLPVEVAQEFERITGGKVVEGYGLSEASPVTHANPVWGKRKFGSIGLPFPDTDAKIVDPETGEELSQGEVGELAVRGPQVMKGYWNRPKETAQALRNGWLHTGDMARMDEEGYFYIVDRKKDMIISGGYNIYPREVEEVLYEHPKILEAAVIGVPHEYKGEIVKAYVVLRKGEVVTAEEVIEFCRERLAPYKVPKEVEFANDLPKSMIGKVLRRELKEKELLKEKVSQ
ncbi:MAG: long-chain fatty acid--CoA ligase [Aquificota bacterium]|nr:MAG: long-chain fatty acid--CoA ligase [Aquificota bacterium]